MTSFIDLINKIPHTTIFVDSEPYLTRYYVRPDNDKLNIFLHHFHKSDQELEFHSHPFKWSYSLILKGGYFEERWNGKKITKHLLLPLSTNYLNNEVFHRVDMVNPEKGTWSLFITGPRIKTEPTWEFWNRETKQKRPWSTNPTSIA